MPRMKRWLLWFLLGFGIYFVFVVDITLHGDKTTTVQRLLSLVFLFWLWITGLAIPIALVVWLVRGSRRAAP